MATSRSPFRMEFTKESHAVIEKFDRIRLTLPSAISAELGSIGLDIRNNIVLSMRDTPKASKTYGKHGHRPSMAGNPPAIDTGRLVGSFEVDASGNSVKVGTNVVYAKFLEGGASAHQITANKKKVLSDGVNVFGKTVNHPGIKPRPFLARALEQVDVKSRIMEICRREIESS